MQSQELEVERELCQGMLRLCAGLSAAGALPSRPAPFNEEEHLFDQRFSCFNHCARPEPLLHQQYAESVDPTGMLETCRVPAAIGTPSDTCAPQKVSKMFEGPPVSFDCLHMSGTGHVHDQEPTSALAAFAAPYC